jgi:MFS family permease
MVDVAKPSPAGRRNAQVLAVCQGLFTCAISIDLTLTALTGYLLAPDKALATLPFALITVAGAGVTLFASLLMARIGRRLGFALGALIGAAGGGISVLAVLGGDFWLFCLGTAAVGVFQAFAQYYGLAAADSVGPSAKSRAISTVLAGSVIAAILGPSLAAWSKDLIPAALFAGAYLMVGLLGLFSAILLLALFRDVEPAASALAAAQEPPRPMRVVVRQPIFVAGVANTIVGSVVMMLVMTAAPLAAVGCGYTIDDVADIIQWHLVGMFLPSLLSGRLVQRFGAARIALVGMVLNIGCAAVAVGSTDLVAFYVALFCLGVGWNFMFVGGTTLLARSYRPAERGRTQGVAELLRSGCTAAASLAAGPLLETQGWSTVNLAILPALLLASIVTVRWTLATRRGAAPAAA